MKFTITRERLQEGLLAVAASVPAKTTLPVLSNVLVTVSEEGVQISGTDLDIAVSTTVPAEVDEEGAVTLLKPKFSGQLFQKYFLPRMKRPYYKVRLDEIGSFTWLQCNSRRTVKDIGNRMQEKFGENVEPLYDRLTFFLAQLERNKFITYKNKEI